MENAVKALYMAAGMLLAIMIASIMIYLFRQGARVGEGFEKTQADQQTERFNSDFLAYARDNNTISDIISVMNMAYDYNTQNDNDNVNSISIIVQMGNSSLRNVKILPHNNLDKNRAFIGNSTNPNDTISLYDLLSVDVKSITKKSGGMPFNASISIPYNEGAGTDQLSGFLVESKYDDTNNKRIFKYVFRCNSVGYNNSGRVNAMTYQILINREFL